MSKIDTTSLRYGFFNAVKGENDVFDRVYTEEDMTDYFRGVIRQNGVYSEVANKLKPSKLSTTFKIKIDTGKAMVNGHWAIIDEPIVITLKQGEVAGTRRDYISLRWSDDNRDVELYYQAGSTEAKTVWTNASSKPASNWPLPIGKLSQTDSKNRDSFEPVALGPEGTNKVSEIILCYVDIPAGSTDISNVTLTNMVGSDYAPYITNLVGAPSDFSVTTYMANLRTEFIKWFKSVQDELAINMQIESVKYVVNGKGTSSTSSTVHLKNIPGYTWSDGDIILPFYNGLLLTEANKEYRIDTSKKNDVLLILNNQGTYIPVDNTLEIVILKGTPLKWESGDNILY